MNPTAVTRIRSDSAQPGELATGAIGGMTVGWARHGDEVRQAQRLRYDVFAGELGAHLETPLAGHDVDRFDDHCEHLLVRDCATREVIGTYRVLTPDQALRAGGSYTDQAFDLAPLAHLRPRMAELGRSCVHRQHRHGGVVLLLLWRALAAFMVRHGLESMVGCVSILPVRSGPAHNLVTDGAGLGAATWNRVRHTHLVPLELQVRPWQAYPLPSDAGDAEAVPALLLRAYLRLGAKVLGPPSWDAAFGSADLPMLMRTAQLPPRYLVATGL